MRKDQTFKAEADKKRDREALKARRANLAGLQQRLKQAGLPDLRFHDLRRMSSPGHKFFI